MLFQIWKELVVNSNILKPLGKYPFSNKDGWLKDRYSVSWQIVPIIISEMMDNGTREQINRVSQTFLSMKKFNI